MVSSGPNSGYRRGFCSIAARPVVSAAASAGAVETFGLFDLPRPVYSRANVMIKKACVPT